ncbi:hypothetical protein DFH07DRAFT_824524 [Mycena maculata]|uniref:Uncharacterized protein n=1 Tax=Mycena maculata TaxID=230809 RepID=A0AAD7IYF4_9AGAR|nr:hypothetical protein DFH07DRAFT_824524 [Mycena maculata]
MCGGPTADGACKVRIKGGKAISACPSAYSFLILAASKFRDSRPCTNVPIVYVLNCGETHWKYNFQMHCKKRHPSWEQIVASSFLSLIKISYAEQTALQIPANKFLHIISSTAPPIPSTPARDRPMGRKRPASCTLSCQAKENMTRTPTRRASKTPRLDLSIFLE